MQLCYTINNGGNMKKYLNIMKSLNYCSLNYILEHFNEIDFNYITLDTSYLTTINNEEAEVFLTNKEFPICFGEFLGQKRIFIDKNYYIENKNLVDNFVNEIVKKYNKSSLVINGNSLITNSLLENVKNNKNIENISLYGDENIYKLDEATYLKLKKSGHIKEIITKGVEDSLEENFDPIIRYNHRNLFGFYNHDSLLKLKDLFILDVNLEEIHFLKYLNTECVIHCRISDPVLLEEFLKGVKNLNLENKIIIQNYDKNKINNIIFNDLENYFNRNIEIELGIDKYNINDYIKYEKRLIDMIKPALKLSPLERYLYAYNR